MPNANTPVPDGFAQFVETEIEPLFVVLQTARAAAFVRMRKFSLIGAGIGLAAGGYLYVQQPKIWPVCLVLVIGFAIIGSLFGWSALSKAKQNFGAKHVGKVSKFLNLGHQADGFEPPNFASFTELGLVSAGDRRHFSDFITGERNGVEFSIFTAMIEERRTRTTTDSEGHTSSETYWATVFHGQMLHTAYVRKFASTTILARDHGWLNTKGRFGKTMKPMGLADPVFEKLFEVYTSDQVEGRFLVDPAFMTRLMKLEDNHKTRKITAAFYDQGVFVALQGGTAFFGKLGKKSTATSLARDTFTAFAHIFDFLDMLQAKNRS